MYREMFKPTRELGALIHYVSLVLSISNVWFTTLCVCPCASVHEPMCTCVCAHVHVCACLHMCLHMCVSACVHVRARVCADSL